MLRRDTFTLSLYHNFHERDVLRPSASITMSSPRDLLYPEHFDRAGGSFDSFVIKDEACSSRRHDHLYTPAKAASDTLV